jgi:hypothetical protein
VVLDLKRVIVPKVIKKELIEYPKENLLNEILETMIIYIGF